MKFFKKINLGLALAILVVIAVTIYCTMSEQNRKNSKAEIQSSLEDFVDVTNNYYTLPSDKQNIGQKLKTEDLKDYYKEIESVLKNKMSSDSSAEIQKIIMEGLLENQLVDSSKITTSFNRKIAKITSFDFDGNQVKVTFNSNVVVKQKYIDVNAENTEKINETSFDIQNEYITLENKDGKWKPVYANLKYQPTKELSGSKSIEQ